MEWEDSAYWGWACPKESWIIKEVIDIKVEIEVVKVELDPNKRVEEVDKPPYPLKCS